MTSAVMIAKLAEGPYLIHSSIYFRRKVGNNTRIKVWKGVCLAYR